MPFFSGRLKKCFSLLFVQFPRGGSLLRTVSLMVSDLWDPEIHSYALKEHLLCGLCLPAHFGRAIEEYHTGAGHSPGWLKHVFFRKLVSCLFVSLTCT